MKPMEPRPPSGFAERYWAIWMVASLVAFLWLEILSLVNGHPENTLSAWVWEHLKIRAGESITQWSAGDLLTFAAYVTVFICWIPAHFWWGRFRLRTSASREVPVKTVAVFIFAILGLVFLIVAAAVAGGMASVQNGGWLLPGGLACWLLAWIISMFPGA